MNHVDLIHVELRGGPQDGACCWAPLAKSVSIEVYNAQGLQGIAVYAWAVEDGRFFLKYLCTHERVPLL